MAEHPKVAAEKLLRAVLPEDLCVSLSALGNCDVQAKKYLYKIFKDQKTHCIQGDRIFSCCIHLSDSAAPDTDRIVAEYLLLKNNEEEYLKVANLTEITPRRSRSGENLEGNPGGEYLADAFRYADARIGDTIRVRRPAQYRPNPDRITTTMILQGLLSEVVNGAWRRDRRFPNIAREEQWRGRWQDQMLHAEIVVPGEDFTLRYDDFATRYLRILGLHLSGGLDRYPNLFGFLELPVPYGDNLGGVIRDNDYGIKLRIVRAYDIRDTNIHIRADVGLLLA